VSVMSHSLTHSLTYSLQSIDCIVLRIALHVLMYVYVYVCVCMQVHVRALHSARGGRLPAPGAAARTHYFTHSLTQCLPARRVHCVREA
jgi:hypothetical protein